jgi:hypothetical protein
VTPSGYMSCHVLVYVGLAENSPMPGHLRKQIAACSRGCFSWQPNLVRTASSRLPTSANTDTRTRRKHFPLVFV